MGIVFDSCSFPQQNGSQTETRLTVMMGGAHKDLHMLSAKDIEKIALEDLRSHLGVHAQPTSVAVSIFPNALPQYHVGHASLVNTIHKMAGELYSNKLSLLGNSYGGIGINETIARAKQKVEETVL